MRDRRPVAAERNSPLRAVTPAALANEGVGKAVSHQSFTIIANDGGDAVGGTFTGLPPGTRLSIGSQLFQIRHTGGHDVVSSRLTTPSPLMLTIQSVPPASVHLLWATNDPPFSLQTATNLAAARCINARPLPVVVGTNNIVTKSITAAHRCYRSSNP